MAWLVFAFVVLAMTTVASQEWQDFGEHKRVPVVVSASGRIGFANVPSQASGITFTNLLDEERSLTNQIFLNGSGVAAGDMDGDGLCDLYFCGLDSANALYRNLGGWRFADVTRHAGVACADQASTGAAFADVDGDGDFDLLVNAIARGTRLFLNDGSGVFREATRESGLQGATGAASMALADVDGDGLVDLYVVNYRSDTMRDMPGITFTVGVTNGVRQVLTVNNRPATMPEFAGRFTLSSSGGILENGEADAFYLNLGGGRFALQDWSSGRFRNEQGAVMEPPYDWGLSAMFHDVNGDGAPDLYVCNDFQSPDRLWINDGLGNFHPIHPLAVRQTSLFSMGMDFADINRDGHVDFFVADMLARAHSRRQVQVMDANAFSQLRQLPDERPQFLRNMLFLNRGNGTFAEIARLAGLEASDWSWCPVFLDVDLDGFEDLLITTGHWRDAQHADVAQELDRMAERSRLSPREQLRQRRRFPRLDTPNVAFRNRGDLTFEETGEAWGFDSTRIAQGIALADLDNDGDLDVAMNCLNDTPLVCRNVSPRPRIAIRLRGRDLNTRGIGARIEVTTPGLPRQAQEITGGGRYLSADDTQRVFAAGNPTNRLRIEVTWRDGRRTVVPDVPANHLVEIRPSTDVEAEPGSPDVASDAPFGPAEVTPHFEDRSRLLGHQPVDEAFDDFARQSLLPEKLSEAGPGIAWFDFNADGWEDLLIGAGKGGRFAALRNDGKGGFIPQRAQILATPADRDLTGVVGWWTAPSKPALLIGLDAYEAPGPEVPAVREISLITGETREHRLFHPSTTGPLALGDVDDDGDMDLFVGGRVIPGRYPEPASSALLRNDSTRLKPDPDTTALLNEIGMVTAAMFTRLDSNGPPALVLATEWGPLRILRGEQGRLSPWDPPVAQVPGFDVNVPLSRLTGWWRSVSAGDFDNDGRLDLVAGNLGRNTSRQRFLGRPIQMFYGDAGNPTGLSLLEMHVDPAFREPVPARDLGALRTAFPVLAGRFPTFESFGAATLADLRAAGLPELRVVEAAVSDSMVLLNRGPHFEARVLPVEAQFSPVFGIAVADFDGDGNQDLVLVQNRFGVHPSESRHDAGAGLWLRGDGTGDFQAVPARESGLGVFGEGRAVAVADYDHDGRPDLAVTQYRSPTLLYRNALGVPGVRLRLTGPPSNPAAIGTLARLHDRDGKVGPLQEIRGGGGYWSQDATGLILTTLGTPEAVEIRWPGGPTERVVIPDGAVEVVRVAPAPRPRSPR